MHLLSIITCLLWRQAPGLALGMNKLRSLHLGALCEVGEMGRGKEILRSTRE